MPFRDIRGHRRLTDLLARSIERGALPPASIFAVPSGIGKRATAVAVAQVLNCLQPKNADACGSCKACDRIARGAHPDVMIVVPGDSGSIKIEQIRDVNDRVGYRPFEGWRRAVIGDEADAMVPHAQNALLKTLEEPPPSSVFMLVTARPDALLPTVRSRCIRLWFAESGSREIDADARAVAERVLVRVAGSDAVGQRLDAAKDLLSNTGRGGAGDRDQLSGYLQAMASLLRDAEIVAVGADRRALANPDSQSAPDRAARAHPRARRVRPVPARRQGAV